MKIVILAGGYGTRLSEETNLIPKPMVQIGGKPMIWHIMKYYSCFGFDEFILCCGYKGDAIKDYFFNYHMYNSDITFDLANNDFISHEQRVEKWKVSCIDTGLNTLTGGRIKKVSQYLDQDEYFAVTYGDGLSNIPIDKLVEFHKAHGKHATVSASFMPGRFGALEISENKVMSFKEKPQGDQGRINSGFFILSPKVLDYIDGPETIFEQEPLNNLAADGELMAYEHDDFFMPMDTIRDKEKLCELWDGNSAPWKIW
ncbi:glucose-1-phosphate cytidylyltransferase [Gammaproteobacteria bacterium]|jgi:glucose-1-phosphate cytidylyltransferase|nr:glucose-1-phosphate cytidylyltransferase [Gammaproteobacteria bacterium]